MIKEDYGNEKDIQLIKVIACIVIYSIIGIVALFTIFVSKVKAITFTYNGNDTSAYELTGLLPINRGYFRGCTSTTSCYSTSYGTNNQSGKVRNTTNVANDNKGMMYYIALNDKSIYVNYIYSVNALYCGPSMGTPDLYVWNGNDYNSTGNMIITTDLYHTYKGVPNIEFNADGSNFMSCNILYSVFKATRSGTIMGLQVRTSSTTSSTFHYLIGYNIESLGNGNELTSSQVQNIINNSGLATASSVNQINQATNEVKQQVEELNQQQEETNNILNDDSIDNPNNAISGMEQNNASNGVISDLLLLPVRLFQNILNNINGTCTSFNLGTMFNHNLTLPCINLSNYLGTALYNVIDVLISGIFVLSIRKKFVDIFENFTALKTGGNELE